MAMLLQLLMNAVPVRLRTLPRRLDRNRLVPKQLGFQFLLAPAFGQRPTDASRSRPLQIVVDRAQPHPATARDLSLPQPQLQPQPQDFLRFPHGQSPCRHSVLLIDGVSLPGDCPASLPPTAARLWKTFRSKLNTIPVDEQNCSPSQRNGVHLQTGMLFGIPTEWRSPSDRNRVHLRPDSPRNTFNTVRGTKSGLWSRRTLANRSCNRLEVSSSVKSLTMTCCSRPKFGLLCSTHVRRAFRRPLEIPSFRQLCPSSPLP